MVRTTRGKNPLSLTLSALALALSLCSMLMIPVSAQAFSNARVIDDESYVLTIEDVALCTKFSNNFDPSTIWTAKGYETCTSEAISTSTLPATLHFKFRVRSKGSEEFLLAKTDAYLMSETIIRGRTIPGTRITTQKWQPSPLINVDGEANPADQVLYGAFMLSNATVRAGSYSLYIQMWNNARLIVPEAQEIPITQKIFTFTIAQGDKASEEVIDCAVPDAQFPKTINEVGSNVEVIRGKLADIREENSPKYAQPLRDYQKMLQAEIVKLNQTASEAESVYSGKIQCMSQYRENMGRVSNLANNALSQVAAFLSKAEYAEKLQNDPCTKGASEAKQSLQNSANVIDDISNQLKNNDAKGGGLLDLAQPGTLQQLERWKSQIADESRNLQSWLDKLALERKKDPTCSSYADLVDESESRRSQGVSVAAKLIALISKAVLLQPEKKNGTAAEENLPENEGVEEDAEASLSVTFNNAQNRFFIKVESNLPEETLTIRATKKGAKSLRFVVNTDEVGSGGFRTKTKLNGYSLTLSFGSIKLDTLRVR